MNKRSSIVVLLGSLIMFSNFAFAENSAKALFMSTAESKITVSSENREISQKSRQKVTASQTNKKLPSDVTYGFQFQVFLLRDGKEVPVNPAKHIFREGDRFRVQMITNTPGIIFISNRNPLGEETYLGGWPIEKAFSKVMLPAEGYFEFHGPKGDDLLFVFFVPCRVEENIVKSYADSGLSRSIRVVADEKTEKVKMKEDVNSKLPVCAINPQNERSIYEDRKQKDFLQASYSKSIRVSYDEKEKTGYILSSAQEQTSRRTSKVPFDMAIFGVIKFNYR